MTPLQTSVSARPEDKTVTAPVLDIVIPVYNEEKGLADCVRRLHAHLRDFVPFPARITIADNASVDATLEVAHRLRAQFDNVEVVHLDRKGRGRALRTVWENSDAQVVAYMDVDLSTDLNALLPLVAPLVSGHSDVAIGTRLSPASRVVRGPKREFISRCYNLILRTSLRARFSDAQCGFKAMRTGVARQLLPLVEDGEWFFDTELLIIAERADLRIHEVPVDWVDDPDSRVDILDTAKKDLQGVWRLGRALATGTLPLDDLRRALGREPLVPGVPMGMVGQLVRFAIIGVVSTLAYMALYLVLHPLVGAQFANFLSLLITAVGNTTANRAFTFGVRGRRDVARHQFQGLVIFAVAWTLTSASLYALHRWDADASKQFDLLVLVLANLVATLMRFLGLRFVFRKAGAAEAAAQHRTVGLDAARAIGLAEVMDGTGSAVDHGPQVGDDPSVGEGLDGEGLDTQARSPRS
jgi:putative flippase GtrA